MLFILYNNSIPLNMDLNFSFFDLIEYWDLVKQYINPLTVIAWSVVAGFLGFIITLIIQIILRKKILVQRRHWSLKVLAYIYMVFFPLFVGFSVSHWMFYHQIEAQLVDNMDTYCKSVDDLYQSKLKEEIFSQIEDKYLEKTGNDYINEGYSYILERFNNKAEGEAVESMTSEVLEGGLSIERMKDKVVSYLIGIYLKDHLEELVEYAAQNVDEKVMLKEGVTMKILDTRIDEILDTGIFVGVVEAYIRDIFGSLKMKAIFIFLIGIVIPLIEIGIANHLENKKQKNINQM